MQMLTKPIISDPTDLAGLRHYLASVDPDVRLSPLDMQRRLLKLEELAVKNGWEVVSKYGVLNTKDVEQFRTLDDKTLINLYSTGLLRRFAESLKVSVIGTKAVLVKNIKSRVVEIK